MLLLAHTRRLSCRLPHQCKTAQRFANSFSTKESSGGSSFGDSKVLKDRKEQLVVEIDRSNLRQFTPPPISSDNNVPSSANIDSLTGYLKMMIDVKGPLSMAEFMKQSLSHPKFGYYTSKQDSDIFGKTGDFTTAPEISQVFGELIGIWCVAMWQQMGSPSQINIVELGPGRGTLMDDLLRTVSTFPEFSKALSTVHLVDVSSELAAIQQKTLSKHATNFEWHTDLHSVPQNPDTPTLFIAQELFDALPVHQFEFTKEHGWCEQLINFQDGKFTPTLSRGATPATRAYVRDIAASSGDRLEVCPSGIALIQDIASRIAKAPAGSSALVIDYGVSDKTPASSLRGIHNHEFVTDILSYEPGSIDLSIDVDFKTLKKYGTSEDIAAFGPISQALFLKEMGIETRIQQLVQAQVEKKDEEAAEHLIDSYERLVSDDQMGSIFKAMALVKRRKVDDENDLVAIGFPNTTSSD